MADRSRKGLGRGDPAEVAPPAGGAGEEGPLAPPTDPIALRSDDPQARIQGELEEREHLYRDLVENSLGYICTHDLEGKLLSVNTPTAAMLGYDPNEMVGRSLGDFVAPAVRAEFADYLRQIREAGRAEGFLRLIARSGEERVVIYRNLVRREPGRSPYVLGHAQDVTEIRRAQREGSLLQGVTRALAETDDFPTALALTMELFCRATGWALGQAWVPSADGRALRWIAAYDAGDPRLQDFRQRSEVHRLEPGKGLPGRAWASRCSEWIHDVRVSGWTALTPAARAAGLRSGIAVPIPAGDQVVAVMEFYVFETRQEDERLLSLVETIATQLGWLIQRRQAEAERQELLVRERAARERLEALSRRLVDVQETERRAIARELHDHVGQLVTGLKLLIEAFGRSRDEAVRAEAKALVNEVLEQVRDLSMDLRPPMLDDLGLVPALVWHCGRYARQTGVEVDFRHPGVDRRFPSPVETAAFRIVQEALTNVARHAGVSRSEVRVAVAEGALRVEVRDRGRGFDAEAALASGSSGLGGMRERARLVGGRLDIESSPGNGTRLEARLPITGAEGEQR